MTDIVSIIVPIYNVEDYLEKCLHSLKGQSYQNLEILMVDDCATDRSGRIAENFSIVDSRFKYIKREKNGGLAAARNTGVVNSTGSWLFFLDSDDWLREDAIQAMLDVAIKESSDIVMCGYYYAWDNGKIEEIDSFKSLTSSTTQKEKIALIQQPSATRRLYNAIFFKNKGFDFPENIKRLEDFPLTIPLLTYTDKISILNVPLYYYFQRKGSISNSNKITDFSFFDKVIEITRQRVNSGFEQEIEFRIILEIAYSKVVLMIKSGFSNKDIKECIDLFLLDYPNSLDNLYLKSIKGLKNFFVKCALNKKIVLLRVMLFMWEIRRKLL